MILFLDCSMITDESNKKSNVICHFLINIAFYYKMKAYKY